MSGLDFYQAIEIVNEGGRVLCPCLFNHGVISLKEHKGYKDVLCLTFKQGDNELITRVVVDKAVIEAEYHLLEQ